MENENNLNSSSNLAINSIYECLNALEEVDSHLNQLNEGSYLQLQENLIPIDSVKLDVTLAYSLASLLYMNLRAQVILLSFYPFLSFSLYSFFFSLFFSIS